MTQAPPRDDDDTMLAAEYALRLLAGDDLAQATRRVHTDAAFAKRVTDWEISFVQMTDDLPAETPSAGTKQAVMDRLFPAAAPTSLWTGVRLWQALTAACVLGLVVLGGMLWTGADQTTGPLYTAEIIAEAGDFRVIAVVDKTANEVILTRTAGAAPQGRILQVWAHGPDAPALSVGLWPAGDSIRLPLPPTIAAVQGVLTLGVSEEPPGGSVTGAPSGRVFGTVDIPDVSDL